MPGNAISSVLSVCWRPPGPGLVLLLCVRREALFDHVEVRDRPSARCRSSGLELEAA